MPPLADVELKGVPSSTPKEHLFWGEDLLDRVSIQYSPISYSPKVEIMLIEIGLGDDAKVRKEIARVVSWAE